MVEDKRIKLYAFVIMPDHIHLIWQMQPLIYFTNTIVLYTPVQHVPLVTIRPFKVNKAELNVTKGFFAITKYKTPVWHPPKNF